MLRAIHALHVNSGRDAGHDSRPAKSTNRALLEHEFSRGKRLQTSHEHGGVPPYKRLSLRLRPCESCKSVADHNDGSFHFSVPTKNPGFVGPKVRELTALHIRFQS